MLAGHGRLIVHGRANCASGELFLALERVLIRERLSVGFQQVEDFIDCSMSVHQPRKSRIDASSPRRLVAILVPEFFEQLDLDLLNLEEALVLLPEEVIDFFVEVPDLELGFKVHFVIVLGLETVAGLRAVLTHHDDGCLDGGEAGEDEIQEDERVGIEAAIGEEVGVERDPAEEDEPEGDEETPAAAKLRDPIGKAFAEGEFAREFVFDVFREEFVLLQALDDFLVEGGEFTELVLQRALDVLRPELPRSSKQIGCSKFHSGCFASMNSAREGRMFSPTVPSSASFVFLQNGQTKVSWSLIKRWREG